MKWLFMTVYSKKSSLSVPMLVMIVMSSIFCMTSCESETKDIVPLEKTPKSSINRPAFPMEEIPTYHEDEPIILGHRRNNPYEIHNMLHAYHLLEHIHHNFVVGDIEPYVNRIYYRVLPSDSIEAAILSEDTSVVYFDYPLDCDIERWGSYYHDPDVHDPIYTWLYAVVPVGHPLPHISSLEVLQECYLPNEPIGNDGHYDDIPDWQNGFAMLEYVAYRESGNADMFTPEDRDLFEEILHVTGNRSNANESEVSRTALETTRSPIWDFISGVNPQGAFGVTNTVLHCTEGIKRASVYIHNFIKCYYGPLNNNGLYYSSTRFRTHCWYHIRFENHHTYTSFYGGSQFLFSPVSRHLGWHSRYGFATVLIKDHYLEDVAWRYATANNAVEQYYTYCQEYNILFPYNMRVWICGLGDGQWEGSTPLFHKRHSPLIYNGLMVSLIGPLFFFIDVPDMALFASQGQHDTPNMYDLVFHEFSHASHYERVGNGYWSNYVLHVITHMGYGTSASGPLHGYCGIGEMWGNFAGSHFLYKYLGYSYPHIYLTSDGYLDTSRYLGLPQGIEFLPHYDWYNPGILAKIHEDSHCTITEIYHALTPDVYSLESLRQSLYNQGIPYEIIDNAYHVYDGWNY